VQALTFNEIWNNYNGRFFDTETMKFWNSRIYGTCTYSKDKNLYYFVTSEKAVMSDRLYTVRAYNKKENSIVTISDFSAFKYKYQAVNHMNKLLGM